MKLHKLLLLAFAFLIPATTLTAQKPAPKEIQLEDIWLYYRFVGGFPEQFNWMNDDQYYTVLEENKIVRYEIRKDKAINTILDAGTLKTSGGKDLKIGSYRFSPDESKVLLITDSEGIYRRSSKAICYVYDLTAQKLHTLHQGEKVSLPTFSPDNKHIGYTHQNDIYYFTMDDAQRTRVTEDGKWNFIMNGHTDWVYEEEFGFVQGFYWAPDSRKIAYYRFDESHVIEFGMPMYGELYPKPYSFKYPKAGEQNAFVELFIYHTDAGKKVKVDIGTEKDQYIPRIKWTQSPDKLAVMRMNRLQNQLDIMLVEAGTGNSEVILTEKEDQYIDEVTNSKWRFLKNGTEFLWQSEENGHNHLYLYGLDGQQIRQITKGSWDVTKIAAVDEANGMVYYMSTEVSPLERHLYSITLEGKKKKQLTKESGWHEVNFSDGNSYYMDTYSTAAAPGTSALYTNKGKLVEVLEDNARLKKTMAEYNLTIPEFFEFTTSEGVDLNGWMIKPADFDPNKKYPVLQYVYGGPGSQTVKNQFGAFNYFWYQMLAQEGYIVVSVDGRGTGGRGEAFKKVTYAQLGKYEGMDQIETAKYLQTLDYVDDDRIGIWGWSFGGYMTSLVMAKGNGIFKAGIAVAPVTSWRYYDTIYTERYLKTPQLNPSGYDDNSPIQFAKDMQGAYLLVHGTADDNVHFQNSMEWVDALVNANKQFDMAFYPNKNHGIYGGVTRFHLYRKMTDFLLENL